MVIIISPDFYQWLLERGVDPNDLDDATAWGYNVLWAKQREIEEEEACGKVTL